MKTTTSIVEMLRDQVAYVNQYEREWVEIDPSVAERIADDLEELPHLVRAYFEAMDRRHSSSRSDDIDALDEAEWEARDILRKAVMPS